MREHVLAVFPHPDDETFGCGGTLALHARAGTPVTLVCATLGEMGRNMGNPLVATRESLPALREQELRAACAILGIGDLRLLGLRDKTLEFLDPADLAARISQVLAQVQPTLVITYYPGHGVHPDHDALAAATVRAVAALPPDRRPPVHGRALGEKIEEVLGPPDLTVDITSVREVKLAAARAHKSQSDLILARRAARMAQDAAFRAQMERDMSRELFWVYRV